MASPNLHIDNGGMKDDLNCVKCKSVLKDACLVPCGCRLCRICIDDLMANGVEFCLGPSEECRESLLLQSVTDYRANRNISKFLIKCQNNGCVHTCQLTNMEEHLRVCPKNSVECPFRELGCAQVRLAAEEMSGHLQRESLSHSEILIGMINNVNNEMEGRKRDIEILKNTDETNQKEIDLLKQELDLKSGQLKLIIDENTLIKEENKVFTDRIKLMLDDIRRAIVESREGCSPEAVECVDKGIQSINQETQLKNIDLDSKTSRKTSIQVPLEQVDARLEWLMDNVVRRDSFPFLGAIHPYKYQLAAHRNTVNSLQIHLRIHHDDRDNNLQWPFCGTVTITVMDSNKYECCLSVSRQCRINKPVNQKYNHSVPFVFLYSELFAAGVDLNKHLRVTCSVALSLNIARSPNLK